MNLTFNRLGLLGINCTFIVFIFAGAARATVIDGGGASEKSIPNEIRATEDVQEQKRAEEDTFQARLDAVDNEISDLKEQTEGLAAVSVLTSTALANLEAKREAAQIALDDYKRADVSQWGVYRIRAKNAFGRLNAALDQARSEVMAH